MTSVISLTTLRCTCLSSKRSNLGSPIFLYRPFAGFFLGFFFGDFFLLALGLGRAGSPHRAWRTVNNPGFLRAALFLIGVFFFFGFVSVLVRGEERFLVGAPPLKSLPNRRLAALDC